MSAISHTGLPASGGLRFLAWKVGRAIENALQPSLPAELRKLPDHLLRDIGIDPRQLPPTLNELVAVPGGLQSGEAIAAFRATTVR